MFAVRKWRSTHSWLLMKIDYEPASVDVAANVYFVICIDRSFFLHPRKTWQVMRGFFHASTIDATGLLESAHPGWSIQLAISEPMQ
jgi:hypothetical protein